MREKASINSSPIDILDSWLSVGCIFHWILCTGRGIYQYKCRGEGTFGFSFLETSIFWIVITICELPISLKTGLIQNNPAVNQIVSEFPTLKCLCWWLLCLSRLLWKYLTPFYLSLRVSRKSTRTGCWS